MKKNIFILTVFIMMNATLPAISPSSLAFSNSYLQRASGIEALYWNPANIHNMHAKHQLSVFPLVIQLEKPYYLRVENQKTEIDLYTFIAGNELDDEDINTFINSKVNANGVYIGYAYKNFAVSYGFNFQTNRRIDREYLDLIFKGNERNKTYHFTKKHNDFSYLIYTDLTLGYGGFHLNPILEKYLGNLPDIYGGASVSYLAGEELVDLGNYHYFLSENKGLNLSRSATVHTASGGHGFKMSFGLSGDVYETKHEGKISVGVSVDNLFGFINWKNDVKERYYDASFDNLDLSNPNFLNDFIKILWVEDVVEKEIDSFTQKLPTIFRLGTVYSKNAMSVSLDFSKTSDTHGAYDSNPQLSAGFEYNFLGWLPVQLGCRFPLGDSPALYSLGLGVRRDRFEFGLGYQSQDALFDLSDLTGMGIAMQIKFSF